MKVIDLFNKITNGEELPNKIRIRNDTLIYNKDHLLNLQDYYYMDDEENATWKIWWYDLNDEVKIIEENKKIEYIEVRIKNGKHYIEDSSFRVQPLEDLELNQNEIVIIDKINEIIDKINSMEVK